MTKKMKAAVVEQFGMTLVLRVLNISSPKAGPFLEKSEECGMCHTDLHPARGDGSAKPTPPLIAAAATGAKP